MLRLASVALTIAAACGAEPPQEPAPKPVQPFPGSTLHRPALAASARTATEPQELPGRTGLLGGWRVKMGESGAAGDALACTKQRHVTQIMDAITAGDTEMARATLATGVALELCRAIPSGETVFLYETEGRNPTWAKVRAAGEFKLWWTWLAFLERTP